MNPHWPKVQQWQRDDSMLDGILGLLQQSFPETTRGLRSLLEGPQSLLADDRLAPRPNNQELYVTPVPSNPGKLPAGIASRHLQDIAAMVGNDQKIPADFLISNVLDPIAWHESYNYIENPDRNPGIAKGARMNPTQLQIGGGPGRGLFQIEGARGVPKKNKKGEDIGLDSFDVAINRAKNYFGYKGLSVPSWINNIQDGTDAADLPADQQKALALLNFTRINTDRTSRNDTGLQKLYNDSTNNANYETAIKDFWSTEHHTRPSTKQKNAFMESLKNISKKRSSFYTEADIE